MSWWGLTVSAVVRTVGYPRGDGRHQSVLDGHLPHPSHILPDSADLKPASEPTHQWFTWAQRRGRCAGRLTSWTDPPLNTTSCYSPGCCCPSLMAQLSAGFLRRSKPAMPWRSQSSEDWLHQEAERKSEPVPEIRSLTEGSPAGTRATEGEEEISALSEKANHCTQKLKLIA